MCASPYLGLDLLRDVLRHEFESRSPCVHAPQYIPRSALRSLAARRHRCAASRRAGIRIAGTRASRAPSRRSRCPHARTYARGWPHPTVGVRLRPERRNRNDRVKHARQLEQHSTRSAEPPDLGGAVPHRELMPQCVEHEVTVRAEHRKDGETRKSRRSGSDEVSGMDRTSILLLTSRHLQACPDRFQ